MNFQSCIGSQRQLINRLVLVNTSDYVIGNMKEWQYMEHLNDLMKSQPGDFGHIVSLGINAGILGVNVLLATGETCFYRFEQVHLL